MYFGLPLDLVLRMLSNYVGEDRFLKGVSLYLKKKLFANSKTHDLWEGIGTATGLNITELMENWITKVRFLQSRCKLPKALIDERLFVCLTRSASLISL